MLLASYPAMFLDLSSTKMVIDALFLKEFDVLLAGGISFIAIAVLYFIFFIETIKLYRSGR